MSDPLDQVEDAYGLTAMQEGMLYHYLVNPQEGVFLEQFSVEIHGQLDVQRFQEAWSAVYSTYPVLRSLLIWEGLDSALQVVTREPPLSWRLEDWTMHEPGEAGKRLKEYLATDRKSGAPLDRPPVARMFLAKESETVHRFVWTFFHAVLDGWSLSRVMKRVLETYETPEFNGLPSERPVVSFASYVECVERQKTKAQERFWTEWLSGFREPTNIRLHGHQGQRVDGAPGVVELEISGSMLDSIHTFARQQRLTLNTLAHAAWALTVHRYTDADDIVFGSTVSGRSPDFAGIEDLIGCCINTLPFRASIDHERRLVDWLNDIQERHLQIREHELTSLLDVQSWSEVEAGADLFNSIVVFENLDALPASSPGGSLQLKNAKLIEQSNFPLALQILPEQSTVRLLLNYDPDQFSREFGSELLSHFIGILTTFPKESDGAVSKIADSEIPPPWSESGGGLPRGIPFLERFADSLAASPENVAVQSPGVRLSYFELAQAALSVAEQLTADGVRANEIVGICAEPSAELVVAIVGTLLAGCAYLPLDPQYPEDRLKLMISKADVRRVLKQEQIDLKLPEGVSRVPVSILPPQTSSAKSNDIVAALKKRSRQQSAAAAKNLAYVIFTSGSTGEPKGVGVTMENMAASLEARIQFYKEPVGTFLLLSSFSFDSSVAGIFWTLGTGGTLVMVPTESKQDVDALSRLIVDHAVTHILCLPSLYLLLLEYANHKAFQSLQTVIVAGESCPRELCVKHHAVTRACTLYNEYGPTEATVWSTVYRVPREEIRQRIPIGRPIPGTEVRVLDSRKRRVPRGVAGEIHIHGPGVVPGYLNSTGPEQRRFWMADKFQNLRFYATGDIAYCSNDGDLVFLGRRDEQVKIRGHRIELGEVELTVKSLQDVEDAVVLVDATVSEDIDDLTEALTNLEPDVVEQLFEKVLSQS